MDVHIFANSERRDGFERISWACICENWVSRDWKAVSWVVRSRRDWVVREVESSAYCWMVVLERSRAPKPTWRRDMVRESERDKWWWWWWW